MKSKFTRTVFSLMMVPVPADKAAVNGPAGYLIGGIIAFLILGYLIYTLIHPDKF